MNQYIGIRVNQQLIPLGGKDAPVQPPSYSGDSKFAIYDNPAGGKNVVINAIAAQAHDMSATMKNILEDALGRQAPGIYLQVPTEEEVSKIVLKKGREGFEKEFENSPVTQEEVIALVLEILTQAQISTWTASHRQADALIRHAVDLGVEGSPQIWAEGSEIGKLIRSAGTTNSLVENFPNSAILGYWLSARSPQPTRVARSLRSQITGYNAFEVKTGASKMDPLGNIPGDIALKMKNGELSIQSGAKADSKSKPSLFGLGAIPSSPEVTGYVCEKIVQESIASSRGLNTALKGCSKKHIKAVQALAQLAILANVDGGVYRSNADLVPYGEPEVSVISSRGEEALLSTKEVNELKENLTTQLEENKDVFAEPIIVGTGDFIIKLLTKRVVDSFSNTNES